MSLQDVKDRLRDIPGINDLNVTEIGGRIVYGFHGLVIGVPPSSSQDDVCQDIRDAVAQHRPQIMSISGYEPGSIRAKLDALKKQTKEDRDSALVELDTAGKQHESVNAEIRRIAAELKKEAEDALQEFASFTNGAP